MDDFGKQFSDYVRRTEAKLRTFPLIAANVGKNFFQDRFRVQNWIGYTTEVWKSRSPATKRNKGRAILTDTGRLKRSIRIIKATWGIVQVGTDVEYAGIHNEGFRGNVSIGEHSRIASRKRSTRFLKNGTASKNNMRKIRGSSHQVKSHTRKINMPRRRFIGDSPHLNRLIQREFISLLKSI